MKLVAPQESENALEATPAYRQVVTLESAAKSTPALENSSGVRTPKTFDPAGLN